jgi:hypothetical protein
MMKNHSDFTVHLHRDGALHSFAPGDPLPDWTQGMITNPYVLGEGAPDPRAAARVRAGAPEPAQPAAAAAPTPDVPVSDAPVPDADATPTAADSSRPPENGIGSGQPVWAEYARSNGIEVEPDWKREDIIAACAKAGC